MTTRYTFVRHRGYIAPEDTRAVSTLFSAWRGEREANFQNTPSAALQLLSTCVENTRQWYADALHKALSHYPCYSLEPAEETPGLLDYFTVTDNNTVSTVNFVHYNFGTKDMPATGNTFLLTDDPVLLDETSMLTHTCRPLGDTTPSQFLQPLLPEGRKHTPTIDWHDLVSPHNPSISSMYTVSSIEHIEQGNYAETVAFPFDHPIWSATANDYLPGHTFNPESSVVQTTMAKVRTH